MSADYKVGEGQIVVALTVCRPLQRLEYLVSHYDAEKHLWKIDDTKGEYSFPASERRNDIYQDAIDRLLTSKNRRNGECGRRPKERRDRRFRLTDEIDAYIGVLAQAMETDKSTVVSYLVARTYAAYQHKLARVAEPDISTV